MSAAPKVMLHPQNAVGLRTKDPERIHNNVAGNFSWRRLVEVLRAGGELRTSEDVEAFVLTDDGIQFFVTRR